MLKSQHDNVTPGLVEVYEVATKWDIETRREAGVLLDGMSSLFRSRESHDLIKPDAPKELMDVCIWVKGIDDSFCCIAEAV